MSSGKYIWPNINGWEYYPWKSATKQSMFGVFAIGIQFFNVGKKNLNCMTWQVSQSPCFLLIWSFWRQTLHLVISSLRVIEEEMLTVPFLLSWVLLVFIQIRYQLPAGGEGIGYFLGKTWRLFEGHFWTTGQVLGIPDICHFF